MFYRGFLSQLNKPQQLPGHKFGLIMNMLLRKPEHFSDPCTELSPKTTDCTPEQNTCTLQILEFPSKASYGSDWSCPNIFTK